ncbi:MAG: hypothetical protein KBA26_00020 [Candidatus Delongbacteria bacterium]|nr:hypothetical protein [Candidatus Delongbacteria bacterium]
MKSIYLLCLTLLMVQCYTLLKDPNQPITDWDADPDGTETTVDAQTYYDPYSMVDNSWSMTYYSSYDPWFDQYRWSVLYDPYYYSSFHSWYYPVYYPTYYYYHHHDQGHDRSPVAYQAKAYKSSPLVFQKSKTSQEKPVTQLFNPQLIARPKPGSPSPSQDGGWISTDNTGSSGSASSNSSSGAPLLRAKSSSDQTSEGSSTKDNSAPTGHSKSGFNGSFFGGYSQPSSPSIHSNSGSNPTSQPKSSSAGSSGSSPSIGRPDKASSPSITPSVKSAAPASTSSQSSQSSTSPSSKAAPSVKAKEKKEK